MNFHDHSKELHHVSDLQISSTRYSLIQIKDAFKVIYFFYLFTPYFNALLVLFSLIPHENHLKKKMGEITQEYGTKMNEIYRKKS